MQTPIRLIVADDHDLFRQGLRSLLLPQPDIEVVGEVEHADELQSVVSATACEILLLDLQMQRSTIDEIHYLSRLTTVIVLTASESVGIGVQALRLGARAICQKKSTIEVLMTAIRRGRGAGLDASHATNVFSHGDSHLDEAPHRPRI